ncbi:aminotransferase class V-fold PLP-dependent enzyme [Streptomyces sp. H39-S7]|uniref:aminotransferase class V-fold PLP-dependent enzyme n=1 Tax=Streptomyces sp. H39-S7 TaxID=3004357 RepID=UPI0022AF8EEE|nr:aminotransferase class V-fold PLP-dependent enzyme [Streptomyces sp. H39-S7]MCZ4125226.1 aminotransferase class V-fold PLP-dependent enzyme [Streptomyces sp. H39-S7]
MTVHLNTAGAGLMPSSVVEALCGYVAEEAAGGSYEAEQRYAPVLEGEVYRILAQVLDAPEDDLALFDSATRAYCSVIGNLPLTAADTVWVTPYEYAGNLILLHGMRRRLGLRIEVVPLLPDGNVDLDWMAAHIHDGVALVSLPHVPSGCGVINPVEEIGKILAPWRCFYAVDACQSVGQVPLSVAAIGCDLLTGAGRKFLRGVRGTGFAAVSPRLRSAVRLPFFDLQVADMVADDAFEVSTDTARRFEFAERNNAAVLGLNAALHHHASRTDDRASGALREAVRGAIEEIPGTRLIDPGTRHAQIVTFLHDRVTPEQVRTGLRARGINVWIAQGSHTPLYMRAQQVEFAVRVSPHYYNTDADIEAFAVALRATLN